MHHSSVNQTNLRRPWLEPIDKFRQQLNTIWLGETGLYQAIVIDKPINGSPNFFRNLNNQLFLNYTTDSVCPFLIKKSSII